jgi:hypothetical protein
LPVPIGRSITAVAVFEIHIERAPPAIINERTIVEGLLPNLDTSPRAILLWRFHFSIARAMINPPRKRKIVEFV